MINLAASHSGTEGVGVGFLDRFSCCAVATVGHKMIGPVMTTAVFGCGPVWALWGILLFIYHVCIYIMSTSIYDYTYK